MTFRDTWTVCDKCGKKFVFTVEEQRRLTERGLEVVPPAACPSCQGVERPTQAPEAVSAPSAPSAQRPVPEGGPHEGTVKWYDPEKGYGFVVHPGGEEVFFHRTGIAPGESPLFSDGERVTYLIEQTEKGPQAIDVAHMDVLEEREPEQAED